MTTPQSNTVTTGTSLLINHTDLSNISVQKYFETGTLVSLEQLTRQSRSITDKELRTEYFWLCPGCSLTFALDFDCRTETVVLKPKFWYVARAS